MQTHTEPVPLSPVSFLLRAGRVAINTRPFFEALPKRSTRKIQKHAPRDRASAQLPAMAPDPATP